MPLSPINKCVSAASTKKTPFFALKMAKKCQFLPRISVFWVLQVGLCSPPLFRGCSIQQQRYCMPLTLFNNCFRAILPYLCRSGKKISNVQNLQCDIELNDLTTCRRIIH